MEFSNLVFLLWTVDSGMPNFFASFELLLSGLSRSSLMILMSSESMSSELLTAFDFLAFD